MLSEHVTALEAFADALFGPRGAPSLDADAHPAAVELFGIIGESSATAPRGLKREQLRLRADAMFARWMTHPATRAAWSMDARGASAPWAALPSTARWLEAYDDAMLFVDDASDAADPPVLRITPGRPEPERTGRGFLEYTIDRLVALAPIEHRASFFFGTPLDDGRPLALPGLHPRLCVMSAGIWSFEAPPEKVLEALGAKVLFRRLRDWIDFAVATPQEHRPWLRPPELPALGLERSGSPGALAVLDPSCHTPAPNPAGVELTPAFARIGRGQKRLEQFNRVGTLGGLPVWIFGRPDHEDIYVFHEVDQRDAVRAQLEALGGVVAWMEGRDLDEE